LLSWMQTTMSLKRRCTPIGELKGLSRTAYGASKPTRARRPLLCYVCCCSLACKRGHTVRPTSPTAAASPHPGPSRSTRSPPAPTPARTAAATGSSPTRSSRAACAPSGAATPWSCGWRRPAAATSLPCAPTSLGSGRWRSSPWRTAAGEEGAPDSHPTATCC
jgi:hypothetical protein